MPKPVTIFDPFVRLKVDMSRDDVSEHAIPPHFTNIQRALQLARQFLVTQDTPNKQVILITDGLPTAHFQGSWLYMLYPADPLTEAATQQAWEPILLDNGYIFAMDDGLNRYYVHKSDERLLSKFIEANYCVLRDKLEKRLHLDGFKPR